MILCDIDGTIAGRNMRAFANACNARWGLDFSEQALAGIGYQAFFALQEVVSYRARFSDEEWSEEIATIDQLPHVLRAMRALPGAVEGCSALSLLDKLTYCTVRNQDDGVRAATQAWLAAQGFPNPERVIFVKSITKKLITAYAAIQKYHEDILIIDDKVSHLAGEVVRFESGTHPSYTADQCHRIAATLAQRMTLIAYGQAKVLPSCKLRTLALINWTELQSVLETLQTKKQKTRWRGATRQKSHDCVTSPFSALSTSWPAVAHRPAR
jgi:hypothetical protein